MKNKYLFVTCALLLMADVAGAQTVKPTALANQDRGYIVKTGYAAPSDFVLQLADGTKTSLNQLAGKIVILQFTANWCSVYREEMPHLEQEVWQAYKNKGVLLIGVDRDEPLEKVARFQKDMKITYPLALDPGAAIFGRFANKKSGVTRNVVIDRDGRIANLTCLYDPQEFSAMVKAIDALVNKPIAALN
ncbi:TlpA family protein disulfide reductase [Mucilaginibacter sp. RB4R14]|uniref:TlpA disulfide reductase family protein n=1 Tax=Mucilaginibacter aurantiaciroseus TaxID=2949308 RepID=UPI002091C4B4|nr:TlpA disulfide reductase family protein [Mucilaginibacter aurantiaciroseus]MCO5936429.1 TlpA family protein disulfide reductase [Mucilaginibacter aurantiaciroseus]